MSSVTLKIEIRDVEAEPYSKKLIFNIDSTVKDALSFIKQRIVLALREEDFGLFQVDQLAEKTRQRWLKENQTLKSYGLNDESNLIFRKKTRPLKIEMVDGSTKTLIIDDTVKVKTILETLCSKSGIDTSEEYGLRALDGKEGIWLSAGQDLYEQGIKENDVLYFDRINYTDDMIDIKKPTQLRLIYCKTVRSIRTAHYPVTYSEAIQLAALQSQEAFGNYNPKKHKASSGRHHGFLAEFLPTMLPEQCLKEQKNERFRSSYNK